MGTQLPAQLPQSIDLITAIPLQNTKKRERGFNQSERIALGLAKSWDLPFAFDAVIRTEMTQSQTSLDINERQINVQNTFINNEHVDGLRIAIIDDVLTTGATIAACAKCLKSNGANKVIAIICGTPKLRIKS